ncbi:hypothetical protein ABI59_10795 [Acidobacteria bacterium Mor1]|nr:hypothetical protein ABI59_10795 [Acidobacteria bacterium Mor1]
MADQKTISQAARMDLQIQLDKLRRASDRCRQGLNDLARGRLSQSAYLNLMQECKTAQRDLETRHTKHFALLKQA